MRCAFGHGGKTDDNVLELDILTYDGFRMTVGKTSPEELEKIIRKGGRKGEIYEKLKQLTQKYASLIEEKFPHIPRRVSGYNLPWLLEKNGFDVAKALIGSESTCVTILKAKVNLIYSPPVKSLLVLGFSDVYIAGDHVKDILSHSSPIALEGMDDVLYEDMKKKHIHSKDLKLLPEGKGWLLVEFGGESKQESEGQAKKLMEYLNKQSNPPDMQLYDDPYKEKLIWKIRESGLGATARVPNEKDTWPGWEDSAVPPNKVGDYLRDLRKLFKKYDYECALYGHFGQGCIHTRIDFDLINEEGIQKFRSFLHEASKLVVSYGGSLSGEHGDGQARAEMLPIMFGPELMQAFREFKTIWDPEWKMNPGKLIDAYSPVENLRLGTQYNPPNLKTHFQFPDNDQGSFARATTRCVGVGDCRRYNEGTMCPSYMVTKEEKHSTRGRARLLFEMLQGKVSGKEMWRDESVKEALDLCLACKGCKGDCPMNVDMATYKAEFLSHYYEGKIRPRSAYAFGLIYWWARIGSHIPRITNFFISAPGFSTIAKWMAGMSSKREIPRFSLEPFKKWYLKKDSLPKKDRKKVILWPDTFNNYFHSEVAKSAVIVLEHLGFDVIVPKTSLCCGRPLYDYGMLDLAKKMLIKIMNEMKEDIEKGTPVVGLEPSCVAVFRDELGNLFPNNIDAQRLKTQVYLLSEFIQKYSKEYSFKPLNKKAIVHGHCHHKSILKFDDEEALLKRLGLDFKILDSGCCGMAGSFGFEEQHYDISMKVGERVLLPEVNQASSETLIIANGFSCREQIRQSTKREAMHLSQVLQMAINNEN